MRNNYSCSWRRATNNCKLAVGKGFKSHTTLECVSLPIPGDLSNRLGLVTSLHFWSSLVAQMVKSLPAMQETWVQSLGREDPLEKDMATHSSILAWEIPWAEETGRLQSMGSQRVKHDWVLTLGLPTLMLNLWSQNGFLWKHPSAKNVFAGRNKLNQKPKRV